MRKVNQGDIIYHKTLRFNNGDMDSKKNRPCIVLFEEDKKKGTYVYSVPLTTNVQALNQYPERYVLVPEPIYKFRDISYANAYGVICSPKDNVIKTGKKLSSQTIQKIVSRVEEIKVPRRRVEIYQHIRDMLLYYQLFEQLTSGESEISEKSRKALRKEKRRSAKSNGQK